MNVQINDYIEKADTVQSEIMQKVRGLIHQNIPNIKEEFKWNRPIFKTTKDIAYLQANKTHVNLGFYKDFEKLNDPDKKLEGTGKTMRHIKLRKVADVDEEQLSDWFKVLSEK
ncbi:MAG TPA: DUF1801 domain-containing protein [Brumimicrobium sp.]|nr:DUF1801 domain-containing protein [Brumimicrobium sp.]